MAIFAQQPVVPLGDALFGSQGKALLISRDRRLGEFIQDEILRSGTFRSCDPVCPSVIGHSELASTEAVIYFPSVADSVEPDLEEAERVFHACTATECCSFVVVASAAIYGASFRNPGLMNESFRTCNTGIAAKWTILEELAYRYWGSSQSLTILRCATLLTPNYASPITDLFCSRIAATPSGHDPTIQILSSQDLAQAVTCVLQSRASGTFNVAPDEAVPLRVALRKAGVKRMPLPRTALKFPYWPGARRRNAEIEYRGYSWTISNDALKRIGFCPQKSSIEALDELQADSDLREATESKVQTGVFDSFGMDKSYIDFFGRTLFKFLADYYWRIEVTGTENIPTQGRGMLVGIHRGFMPWDGVMALHLIVRATNRYPRFLIHPGLVKFPFLANFMTKLGGIIACQENATHVLGQDELLGVFPEGIHGAFTKYSEAYKIQHFHRDAFVKMALINQTPIIPFVNVGSAEIFPILAHIKSQSWTNYSEWPSFPITPTFPVLPIPLPSKWHTRFLEPMHIENDYGPEDASKPGVVRLISREVRKRMQATVDEMLGSRRHIFWGSIFATSAK